MDKMEKILNKDVLKKILTIINIDIIKKQKEFKYELNKELNKYKDIYYMDKRYLIYKNNLNNIAIRNRNNINKTNVKLIKVENNNSLDNINNIILNNSNNIILETDIINIKDDNIIIKNTSNINNIKIHVKYI